MNRKDQFEFPTRYRYKKPRSRPPWKPPSRPQLIFIYIEAAPEDAVEFRCACCRKIRWAAPHPSERVPRVCSRQCHDGMVVKGRHRAANRTLGITDQTHARPVPYSPGSKTRQVYLNQLHISRLPTLAKARRLRRRRAKLRSGTTTHAERLKILAEFPSLLLEVIEALPTVMDPKQTREIRNAIAEVVTDNIGVASLVLSGDKHWSPVQARVFGMLLDKVAPAISENKNLNLSSQLPIQQLTRQQLQAIAAGDTTINISAPEPEPDYDYQPAQNPKLINP